MGRSEELTLALLVLRVLTHHAACRLAAAVPADHKTAVFTHGLAGWANFHGLGGAPVGGAKVGEKRYVMRPFSRS